MAPNIDGNKLKGLIITAFDSAQKDGKDLAGDDGKTHRALSALWVEKLGQAFRREFGDPDRHRVFFRPRTPDVCDQLNKADFDLYELLYDISVCSVGRVKSIRNGKKMWSITEGHWQVESELAEDSQEAMFDFNKLILGSAANKLFVGPWGDVEGFKRVLGDATRITTGSGKTCLGNLYIAFVPHPRDWKDAPSEKIEVFQFENDAWKPIQ